MKYSVLLLLLTGAAPAAAQVSAEPWLQSGTYMLTLEMGGAAFTDFQRAQARPLSQSVEISEFQRRVSARTSGTLGGSFSYWAGAGWGFRVGGAWVPTSFSVWNEEAAQRVLDQLGDGEEQRYSGLDVVMADVALLFRVPRSIGRVAPYGLVGGSYIQYRRRGDEELPPEAGSSFEGAGWATPAALIGVGAVIPLQKRNLLMSFELTDHIGRTPLDDQGRGEQFQINGVTMQLDPDPRTGTDGVGLTSNLRLTVGLTLPIR